MSIIEQRLQKITDNVSEISSIEWNEDTNKYVVIYNDESITFTNELFDEVKTLHNIDADQMVKDAIHCLQTNTTEIELTD